MASYTSDTIVRAPRSVVYDIFADRENNGDFLPVTTRLKSPGSTERQGVGAVHFIGVGRVGVSEQITRLVPDERIEYKIVSGVPVKSHTGTITFTDSGAGTRVVYTMDSQPKLPVPRRILELVLRALITGFVKGATKEAESRKV